MKKDDKYDQDLVQIIGTIIGIIFVIFMFGFYPLWVMGYLKWP